MTPAQQEAKELIELFLPEVRGADRYNYNLESMNIHIAKKCALIAVEKIIEAIDFDWMEVQNLESQHRHYNEVKEEIKKYNP
jgi:hypothetical protein